MKDKKISLVHLHQKELDKKRSSLVLGGGTPGNCGCGCHGPSNQCDNRRANWNEGLHSPGVNPTSCPARAGTDPYILYVFWNDFPC